MTEDVAARPRREQARSRATRAALLQAGRACFVDSGFAEASVNEIVARAGSGVGTLYHHFGGKNELFLALYEAYQARQEQRAASAVAAARDAGETDPVELFLAGARAFLDGTWEEHDLARLFSNGDSPLGFDLLVRSRHRRWLRGNARLLVPDQQPFGEALALVLTTVSAEAGREVAMQRDAERAAQFRDEVLVLLRRLATP
jgi:AcrR family transcriptional regulator